MLPRLGIPELLVILFIIMLIFGDNRLPESIKPYIKESNTILLAPMSLHPTDAMIWSVIVCTSCSTSASL